MIRDFLYSRIDNSPLVVFRICFGLLLSLETFGAIATGWVRRNLVEPEFTFSFIGFEWLQPLPHPWMYVYFVVMGLLGLAVMAGYRYRFSMAAFTIMWTAVYLMQKTAYNNHYYLLVLICALMCFMPAHRNLSLDVRRNPTWRSDTMPAWVKWLVIGQLGIVYTYAALAKLYTDWLDFSFIGLLMQSRAGYPVIGPLLQESWAHQAIGGFGIVFDLLVVPALLWRPTRNFALAASVFFHLFNSIVLQIGIFPYLSLAFILFFYPGQTIRKRFLRGREAVVKNAPVLPGYHRWATAAMALYLGVQLTLPLRHHFIPGDVLWTEEGHRLSWRMMLRSRQGAIRFRVVDKSTKWSREINLKEHLTPSQIHKVMAYPDFIWQFAQYLKQHYREQRREVAVYARGQVRINTRPFHPFVDPETDLASIPWDPFRPSPWILPAPWEE
ncbi:HTTM domain-containing protein [Robiginitalea sediminis]|uniref:HTTM domain-containing protein n=1 Tax=Robiginitalea sediminis TaxID=1982593 RepID=UPI000B4B2CBA|nr:HTTM domain-containing protein [Robiginitalea sediminis]